MEGKVLINRSTMKSIADSIRAKIGSSEEMLPSEMPANVDSIKGSATLQSKTVTPADSAQSVTADDGYDGLDTVTVNAIPDTYVLPTATKGATTWTPKTTDQTIAAGTYCSGKQTIAGDANLIAANILSGKTIFGVAGSASSGGEMTTGTFSVSDTKTQEKVITHGLGKKPTYAIFVRNGSAKPNVSCVLYAYNISGTTSGASISNTSIIGALVSNITFSNTTVTLAGKSSSSASSNTLLYGTYRYIIGVS